LTYAKYLEGARQARRHGTQQAASGCFSVGEKSNHGTIRAQRLLFPMQAPILLAFCKSHPDHGDREKQPGKATGELLFSGSYPRFAMM
jgi:hypothetical protein